MLYIPRSLSLTEFPGDEVLHFVMQLLLVRDASLEKGVAWCVVQVALEHSLGACSSNALTLV